MNPLTKIYDHEGGVDKTLIKIFLEMTPEDRLLSNDNAIRTILELRNAVKHGRKTHRNQPKQPVKTFK